jgi:Ser/Thr protein kinase RdoA (MazF antagonist)
VTDSPASSDVTRVLQAYALGDVEETVPHAGTAGKTWQIRTSRGVWLLRLRGVRTSTSELVAYDHGLRDHLLQHGVPTAAPLTTRDGRRCVLLDGRAFELYPWVEGCCLGSADATTLSRAARGLAQFHAAAADYPGARSLPPVAQYTTLGCTAASQRMENPVLLSGIYADLRRRSAAGSFAPALRVARSWLERLETEFAASRYDALPQTVTHGDFTLANLLFDTKGNLAGIFDFDWSRWGPRVRDLADGMYFIAGIRRSPLEPGNIWSLTESVGLTVDRCADWLNAYQSVAVLSAEEAACIPLALAARWLSIRVEGMAKVPPDERLRFALANVTEPLQWLEENWAAVAARL